ncbi:MAG: hypothetical protein WB441_01435 [Nocardioidaceae bacterium]
MFVLGLILILLSVGSIIAVVASGTDDRSALYGGDVTLPTLVVFLAGAAALLLLVIGLSLIRSGTKRASQNRKNRKKLRRLERDHPTTTAGAGTTRPGADTQSSAPTADGYRQDPPPSH